MVLNLQITSLSILVGALLVRKPVHCFYHIGKMMSGFIDEKTLGNESLKGFLTNDASTNVGDILYRIWWPWIVPM